MFGIRKDRLNEQLQQEIATIVHQDVKDPGIGFVTITRVELSSDLSHAKVSFSCLGGEDERLRSQESLDRAAPFIRSLIKKRLRLKIIPELAFSYDKSIAQSIDLSAKLDQLKYGPPPDADA